MLLADALRAVIELALARARLARQSDIFLNGQAAQGVAPANPAGDTLVDRVAFVIPRVAARLPWRADCVVQAMAAQRWLGCAGIETRLVLGVPKEKLPDFEAHAWLTAGDRVVTGGDVSGYTPLTQR